MLMYAVIYEDPFTLNTLFQTVNDPVPGVGF